jgi:hypothetical protein
MVTLFKAPFMLPAYMYVPFSSSIHFTVKMMAAWLAKMLVSYHITSWCYNSEEESSLP